LLCIVKYYANCSEASRRCWPLGLIAQTRLDGRARFILEALFFRRQIQRRATLGADDRIVRPRLGRGSPELRAAARRAFERDLDLRHEAVVTAGRRLSRASSHS